jgi:hypothetical protein
MKKTLGKFVLTCAAVAASFIAAGQANADVIYDAQNAPVQFYTPVSVDFIATSSPLEISFAGYQVPSYEYAEDISLTVLGGGPNLLGQTWSFVPAEFGSLTSQFDDGYGTGTNGLGFAGVSAGYYDTYSQSLPLVIGDTYQLNFLFTQEGGPQSDFVVSAGQAVPEPSSFALLGLGGIGLAIGAYRRRRIVAA